MLLRLAVTIAFALTTHAAATAQASCATCSNASAIEACGSSASRSNTARTANASAAFPAIDAVRAFPTTLFVDDTGKIRIAHQGFAGPATGEAHTEQRRLFEGTIERLLAEAESHPNVR